jgi:hypothetical protein
VKSKEHKGKEKETKKEEESEEGLLVEELFPLLAEVLL